jgi:hypothetical protein
MNLLKIYSEFKKIIEYKSLLVLYISKDTNINAIDTSITYLSIFIYKNAIDRINNTVITDLINLLDKYNGTIYLPYINNKTNIIKYGQLTKLNFASYLCKYSNIEQDTYYFMAKPSNIYYHNTVCDTISKNFNELRQINCKFREFT